jgi:hypothetical protein
VTASGKLKMERPLLSRSDRDSDSDDGGDDGDNDDANAGTYAHVDGGALHSAEGVIVINIRQEQPQPHQPLVDNHKESDKKLDADYAATSEALRAILTKDSVLEWFLFLVFLRWPARNERFTCRGVAIMAYYIIFAVVSVFAMAFLLYSMYSVPTQIIMLGLTTTAVAAQVKKDF